MLIDKELVFKRVNRIISEANKSVIAQTTEIMTSKGFSPAEVANIFTKRNPVEILNPIVLLQFTSALYDVTKDNSIKPDKIYTPSEISVANSSKNESVESVKFPLIFNDVIEINKHQWLTKLTISEIVDLVNKMIINYNPETQRESNISVYNDKIITSPKVNLTSLKEIADNIENNKQFANCITLNILNTGEDDVIYFPKSYSLQINNGEIDIIDGWHRLRAIIQAYNKGVNVDMVYEIRFTNFELDDAKQFIVQEDKRNPIAKTQIKHMDVNNYSNLLTQKINSDAKSILRDKIVTDSKLVDDKMGVVRFDRIMDTIKLTFNPQDNADVFKYGKYIIDGINFFVENNMDMLENSKEIYWIACIVRLYQMYLAEEEATNLKINLDELAKITYTKINKSLINQLRED